MFVFTKDRSYDWPVKVLEPDGGQQKESQFTARFLALSTGEMEQLTEGLDASQADLAVLRAALVGWGPDLVDHAEAPIPFGEEAREALLAYIPARRALGVAYLESLGGAQEGNSGLPPGIGRPRGLARMATSSPPISARSAPAPTRPA